MAPWARSKFDAPMCSNLRYLRSKRTALKYLWHYLDFSASAAVIRARGIVPLPTRGYAPITAKNHALQQAVILNSNRRHTRTSGKGGKGSVRPYFWATVRKTKRKVLQGDDSAQARIKLTGGRIQGMRDFSRRWEGAKRFIKESGAMSWRTIPDICSLFSGQARSHVPKFWGTEF